MKYLNKHTGSLVHTFVWQLRKSRSRLRQRGKHKPGCNETEELAHMQRRLQEWEKGIPIQFWPAVDALIAERMGVGLAEGQYWSWGGTEDGYTEALHRFQDRGNLALSGRTTTRCHTEPEIRQITSFRRMGRRSWYTVHQQLRNWQGGRREEIAPKELRCSFVKGIENIVPGSKPRPQTRVREGGGASDKELREYSLFAQYVARIEQMPREPQEGSTEYRPLTRMDFEKLSRRRQVIELQRTGMLVEKGEEAIKFYIKTDKKTYPSTHVDMAVPGITPRTLSTSELLYHQYKLEDKIRRLYQRLRELRREARHCMRHKQQTGGDTMDGKYISGGVARVRYTYDTRHSINQNAKLITEIKTQIKARLKAHKDNGGLKHR